MRDQWRGIEARLYNMRYIRHVIQTYRKMKAVAKNRMAARKCRETKETSHEMQRWQAPNSSVKKTARRSSEVEGARGRAVECLWGQEAAEFQHTTAVCVVCDSLPVAIAFPEVL